MTKFLVLLHYLLFMLFLFAGSVMLWSIPFAIAGRGSRLLFLIVLPAVLLAWMGIGALVCSALGVNMMVSDAGDMRAAALVPIFFYLSVPVVACIAARFFGCWHARDLRLNLRKE